jgi:hypothetical protein
VAGVDEQEVIASRAAGISAVTANFNIREAVGFLNVMVEILVMNGVAPWMPWGFST